MLPHVGLIHLLEKNPARLIDFFPDLAGWKKIRDGLAFPLGAERHTLVHRRQEPIGPVTGGTRGHTPRIRKNHIRREIIGLVPQSVGHPRSHHRKAVQAEATALLEGGGGMAGGLSHHRVDNRQLIRHGGDMGKKVGDPEPALTSLLKFPVVFAQEADFSKEYVRLLVGLERLSMQFLQAGLVVEGIHLTEAPTQADVNHPLGLGGVMRFYRLRGVTLTNEQRRQGRTGETPLGPVEKVPTAWQSTG